MAFWSFGQQTDLLGCRTAEASQDAASTAQQESVQGPNQEHGEQESSPGWSAESDQTEVLG